jgi:POT family proton-dependent oligopeptide transporter
MGEYPWMIDLATGMGVRAEHAGLLGVFGGIAVLLFTFSIALWMISGRVVAWMHGAEKTK